ncbi:MAG TPA: hypothetical protein VNG71_17395 [Pyrinomonadaceae bacterium]|nr:hypothetical protein [Pyrinomonadaceae bacterium]
MKIKILLLAVLLVSLTSIGVAQTRARTSPGTIVRNLYAARKRPATDPFFQTKSRARLNKYFTKDLGDLIWKDAVTSAKSNEVGALDGDPLYNAQDMKITAFRIKPPQFGEGNLNLADVPVTFKNFGKEQTILFRLERDKTGVWKISDIFYPGNPDDASSLRKMLKSS